MKKEHTALNINKNIIKPAVKECNYFLKHNSFKNFDNLVNDRARHFTIQLIKNKCAAENITKHDYLIKWYENVFERGL